MSQFLATNFKKIFVFLSVVLVLILIVIFFLVSQKKQTNSISLNPSTPQTQKTFVTLKGVSLSPLSFAGTNFSNFFVKAKDAGAAILWQGNWTELENPGSAPYVVEQLSKQYSYQPIINLSYFKELDNGTLETPTDNKTLELYNSLAVNFAKTYQPEYLGLGVELNRLEKQDPTSFTNFVKLFSQTYSAIKKVSTSTRIFVSFQLEQMKGLNGGLLGGINDTSKNQWALLHQFSQADLIAFTTYPDLIYKTPAEIPNDYYTDIKNHTDKPLAFTEMGWPSSNVATGWESDETSQADFINKFFTLTKTLNPELAIWSFLYDQNIKQPFTSMGIMDNQGKEKMAFSNWKSQ